MCSHMAPLKIWFAWSDVCIRCLKDLSTGGILLLKEYSKGLDFHAVYSVKSDLHAHKTKTHTSFQYLLASSWYHFLILFGYVAITLCYKHCLPLWVFDPSQCHITAYMQRRAASRNCLLQSLGLSLNLGGKTPRLLSKGFGFIFWTGVS